ncbi:MAG TPA: bifunctional DNA primase/polymerase, partial [Pseudomonadales bacterium]|nr:bifunctional DNA primase/polymerase [Pseudomonadales bacterium]
MKSDILLRALELANQGISVVPVATDGSKRPGIASWKEFQERRPTTDELMRWFSAAEGVGVICGKVSGNLEMLELEGRAVADKMHLEIKELAISANLGHIWDRLNNGYVEMTPSGGLHWLYRIDGEVPGNTKLARRPGENGGIDVLAETRGEGGFVIVAPTNGTCHPSGGKWEMLAGSPASIPTLTVAERNELHRLFMTFDAIPKQDVITEQIKQKSEGLTPGDDYNAKVTWDQILEPLGWKKIRTDSDGTVKWCRPGKDFGISATSNYAGTDKFYVFSSSTIFEPHRSYSKFAVFSLVEHQGDFSAAAKALRSLGYGQPRAELGTLEVHSPSLVQLHNEEGEVVESSWIPKPIVETELADEPPPSMLRREDGNCLLYAGKINAIFGESESGKTWLALEAIRQELEKNNIVFYIDFEDSARGILNRLKTMRVPTEKFKFFRYANPDTDLEAGIGELMRTEIMAYLPTLIVVDGVNAAMNLLGLDLEKNKDATEFSRRVLKPLRIGGAGILTIDHVTKSKDNRGNYAIGAQAKRADIDGAAFAVSVAMPFGRGIDGALDITCTKDRPGFVRAICPDAKTVGVANLRSLPDGGISVSISGGTVVISNAEQRMEQVSHFLEAHGYEMNFNDIKRKLREEGNGMGSDMVKMALDALVGRGDISVRNQG